MFCDNKILFANSSYQVHMQLAVKPPRGLGQQKDNE
jgi:hypothetical protein